MEQRRRLGIGLLRQGLSLDEVSRQVGCHASSVFRWREAYRQNGKGGIKAKPIMGRPRKLVARDMARLVELLNQGPRAHGYKSDWWTTTRIAKLIRRNFGVRYHRDHIGRLMSTLNWTYVKPGFKLVSQELFNAENELGEAGGNLARLAEGWVPLCKRSRSE